MKEILLKQHIGSPAKAVVKPGDRVRRGGLLAVPEGLGANVHSSVDGLIKEVKEDRILVEETAEQGRSRFSYCEKIKYRFKRRLSSGQCSGVRTAP